MNMKKRSKEKLATNGERLGAIGGSEKGVEAGRWVGRTGGTLFLPVHVNAGQEITLRIFHQTSGTLFLPAHVSAGQEITHRILHQT